MTILVAVDFSEVTQRVLEAVRRIPRREGAKVVVLHVAEPDPEFVGWEAGPGVVRTQVAKEFRRERQNVEAMVATLREEDVDAIGLVVQGPTIATILDEAERLGAELLVVGGHGRGAAYDLVVGSVSAGVIRKAKVPVLVVPDKGTGTFSGAGEIAGFLGNYLAHTNHPGQRARENRMKRQASAVWKGGLKDGKGTFGVGSGAIKDQKYDFRMRFENDPGTNPEELIAAAHAGCFSMALSAQLGERGITPEAIETTSTITFEEGTLKQSALETTVRAKGADKAKVEEAAAAAKAGCPISKVLNLEITLHLTVEA